jgi:hypothetical protein
MVSTRLKWQYRILNLIQSATNQTSQIVAFAQVFYTVLVPGSCSNDDLGDDPGFLCNQSEYIFRAYTMLLGDFSFERETFQTRFALILLIFYSFMVSVVWFHILSWRQLRHESNLKYPIRSIGHYCVREHSHCRRYEGNLG